VVFHIVFVGDANICRSAGAAAVARRVLGSRSTDGVLVSSAGMRTAGGAAACPRAVTWFRSHGFVDLAAHRSVVLTRELIEEADLVVAAERTLMSGVDRAVPAARPFTFTLTEVATLAETARRLIAAGRDAVGARPVDSAWRAVVRELDATRGQAFPQPPARSLRDRLSRQGEISGYDVPDTHGVERAASHRRVLPRVDQLTRQLCNDLSALVRTL
jgi:protein-tyrosine-phosphatase